MSANKLQNEFLNYKMIFFFTKASKWGFVIVQVLKSYFKLGETTRQPELQGEYMSATPTLCIASSKHLLKASCCQFLKSSAGRLSYPLGLHYQLHHVKQPNLKIGITPLNLWVPRETDKQFQGVRHSDYAEFNGAILVHKVEKLQLWWLASTGSLTLSQHSSTADSYDTGESKSSSQMKI